MVSQQGERMLATLNGGVLDGHILAIAPDTVEIRAVTPQAVYIYWLRMISMFGDPGADGLQFGLREIVANDLRDRYTANVKPLADLAWRECEDTTEAMHTAGLWQFHVQEGDCA